MGKHKITLWEIGHNKKFEKYEDLYEYIMKEIAEGTLIPIKRSGVNGRKPALPISYWKIEEEKDYSDILDELKFRINPGIDVKYYMSHPDKYEEDQKYVRLISDYLTKNSGMLDNAESINERSFEIFHEEKYLSEGDGMGMLKRLSMDGDRLNFYKTTVPMAYYSHYKETPQNILILENKDTFYSMRKYMIEESSKIFGLETGTLIFGSGKAVISIFGDYIDEVEPYFGDKKNNVYYFGDLDYEGIMIYETLYSIYSTYGKRVLGVEAFITAYERMIDKAEKMGFDNLPYAKERQRKDIGTMFLDKFNDEYRGKIIQILESGKYIPQEILNVHDYRNNGEK